MTLLTAGALTDPQLPATASNVCTTDARLGGVGRIPPQTKILAMPVTHSYIVGGHNRMVRHVRTPLYRPRGIISGFAIVLHYVILPPFPPCDLASR